MNLKTSGFSLLAIKQTLPKTGDISPCFSSFLISISGHAMTFRYLILLKDLFFSYGKSLCCDWIRFLLISYVLLSANLPPCKCQIIEGHYEQPFCY